MSKLTTVAIAALAALVVSGTAALAANQAMSPKLVRTIMDKQLGEVLTTSEKQAIYIWKSEPKGRSAAPEAVREGVATRAREEGRRVPMHYFGIKGDFGTIRRPTARVSSRSIGGRSTPTPTRSRARCSATTSTTGSR